MLLRLTAIFLISTTLLGFQAEAAFPVMTSPLGRDPIEDCALLAAYVKAVKMPADIDRVAKNCGRADQETCGYTLAFVQNLGKGNESFARALAEECAKPKRR